MNTRKWFNPMQPQTLQGAVFLLYFRAVFGLLSLLFTGNVFALIPVAGGAAAYLIANEKKPGWYLGIVVAAFAAFFSLLSFSANGFGGLIGLMFDGLLLILLLHPISRGYVKTWFK